MYIKNPENTSNRKESERPENRNDWDEKYIHGEKTRTGTSTRRKHTLENTDSSFSRDLSVSLGKARKELKEIL